MKFIMVRMEKMIKNVASFSNRGSLIVLFKFILYGHAYCK